MKKTHWKSFWMLWTIFKSTAIKLTCTFNLYTEVDRLVRSKKIQKVNKLKNHHWSVQSWKHLQNSYSIEPQIHRKIALAMVHQKRAVHLQPGGYTNNFVTLLKYCIWCSFTKHNHINNQSFECNVKSFFVLYLLLY